MSDTLKYKEYFRSVHFSAEDDVFYGKITGINDLINFEGSTVSEPKSAFHEAVEDYLATCKNINKEPDKIYKGSFNISISSHLHRKAAIAASLKNITLNDFVKTAIDSLVKTIDKS